MTRSIPVVLEIFRSSGDGFLLNISRLGDALGSNDDVPDWYPMLADATSVESQRGGQVSRIGVSAEVGALSLTLVNAFDLESIQNVTPDSPIRLSHASGERIFTGTLRSIRLGFSFDKLSRKKTIFTYMTAVDGIRSLANTMRYGAAAYNGSGVAYEMWNQRIARLMQSSQLAYQVTGNGDGNASGMEQRRIQDVVYESSLLNHLDLACNSVRAKWFIDSNNVVQFFGPYGSPARPFRGTLTDRPDHAGLAGFVPYVDIDLGYDSETLLNDIKVINHGRMFVDGRWLASDLTYGPYRDETSILTWGAESATIDISLALPQYITEPLPRETPIEELVAAIFAAQRSPRLTVKSVVIDGLEFGDFLASLELYDRVSVEIEGLEAQVEIVSIKHSITPRKWLCTLNFKEVW